jgi:hypothetical protein
MLPREWSTTVLLHGKPLDLHLAAPRSPAVDHVVVLYASGDGGWWGAAVDMFHQIATAGYYAVGFSSRAFLKVERPRGGLAGAAQLAAEYEQILTRARGALGLDPTSHAVMTGWSRGAAFAVLAASEPAAQSDVLGVIAIGLSDGEDLVINGGDDETDDGPVSGEKRRRLFDPYARIARLAPVPCAVIQASGDNYLPAASARQLFGPDTPLRRFYTIEAKNHRFSGGKTAFNAALLDAIHWIVSQPLQESVDPRASHCTDHRCFNTKGTKDTKGWPQLGAS